MRSRFSTLVLIVAPSAAHPPRRRRGSSPRATCPGGRSVGADRGPLRSQPTMRTARPLALLLLTARGVVRRAGCSRTRGRTTRGCAAAEPVRTRRRVLQLLFVDTPTLSVSSRSRSGTRAASASTRRPCCGRAHVDARPRELVVRRRDGLRRRPAAALLLRAAVVVAGRRRPPALVERDRQLRHRNPRGRGRRRRGRRRRGPRDDGRRDARDGHLGRELRDRDRAAATANSVSSMSAVSATGVSVDTQMPTPAPTTPEPTPAYEKPDRDPPVPHAPPLLLVAPPGELSMLRLVGYHTSQAPDDKLVASLAVASLRATVATLPGAGALRQLSKVFSDLGLEPKEGPKIDANNTVVTGSRNRLLYDAPAPHSVAAARRRASRASSTSSTRATTRRARVAAGHGHGRRARAARSSRRRSTRATRAGASRATARPPRRRATSRARGSGSTSTSTRPTRSSTSRSTAPARPATTSTGGSSPRHRQVPREPRHGVPRRARVRARRRARRVRACRAQRRRAAVPRRARVRVACARRGRAARLPARRRRAVRRRRGGRVRAAARRDARLGEGPEELAQGVVAATQAR